MKDMNTILAYDNVLFLERTKMKNFLVYYNFLYCVVKYLKLFFYIFFILKINYIRDNT